MATEQHSESPLDPSLFRKALLAKNAAGLNGLICQSAFVLIRVEGDEGGGAAGVDDQADELGALTADFEGTRYLVAFSRAEEASEFVQSRSDLFGSDDEVNGFLIDGGTMLDYLDDSYGLLINPDTSGEFRLKSSLVSQVLDEFAKG